MDSILAIARTYSSAVLVYIHSESFFTSCVSVTVPVEFCACPMPTTESMNDDEKNESVKDGDTEKPTFSMKLTKKKTKSKLSSGGKSMVSQVEGFESMDDIANRGTSDQLNTDLPKTPLVIPLQQNTRQSLQEQARLRRAQEEKEGRLSVKVEEKEMQQQQPLEHVPSSSQPVGSATDGEDQAAIDALNAEALGVESAKTNSSTSKMVIQGANDTFQRGERGGGASAASKQDAPADSETQQFQQELKQLVPELPVDSQVYRQVPIAEFGAAMLRGMGWTGTVDTSDKDTAGLPRPSRLGLGATPKLLDAPTHNRPRRQDQVTRDEQLKQQQKEYEEQRRLQLKMDKQRTIQEGSIILVNQQDYGRPRRAIIRKWQGVPGLNMALVQFEGESEPTKIKKGDARLVDREELQENPFKEPAYHPEEKTQYLGTRQSGENSEEREDRKKDDRRSRDRDVERSRDTRRSDRDRRDYEKEREHRRTSDRDRRRNDDSSRHHESSRKRKNEREVLDDRKRHRDDEGARPSTWLVPNIRVRIITQKLGKQYYKEKGMVIDVSAKGSATITLADGQLLQVPERYLETSLPKVGGNACILTGKYRLAKGRLLERDSRANRGVVQVFEDLNVVTTSLDDMAEWCGPLDDDLMN